MTTEEATNNIAVMTASIAATLDDIAEQLTRIADRLELITTEQSDSKGYIRILNVGD